MLAGARTVPQTGGNGNARCVLARLSAWATLLAEVLNVRGRVWLLLLLGIAPGCHKPPPPVVPRVVPSRPQEPTDAKRMRAAAVTIQFANGSRSPQEAPAGQDHLQVAGVFGDIQRDDVGVLADLVGRASAGVLELETCVRQADPAHSPGPRPGVPPNGYMQLLDVGNLTLRAGSQSLPLRVRMVPDLFEAARGVRYDLDRDVSRTWLAAGALHLAGTGGDGVPAFDVAIDMPRPLRVTWVAGQPVHAADVTLTRDVAELSLRWGSVDGRGEVDLLVGADVSAGLGWLHCRVKDDGEFTVPSELVQLLPTRTAERPWLLRLLRAREVPFPGLEALPLRLELSDAVSLH